MVFEGRGIEEGENMANTELNDANLIKAINWRLYRLQPTQ